MKKILGILLSAALTFGLAACGNSNNTASSSAEEQDTNTTVASESSETESEVETEEPVSETESTTSTLVDNSVVVIDGEVLGNTQYVAYVIQENTEGRIGVAYKEIPENGKITYLTNRHSNKEEI